MPVLLSFFSLYNLSLNHLSVNKKLLINTLNAHCFNMAQEDSDYAEVLLKSDVLLPDGISVVLAKRWLTGQKLKKIAGEDLFFHEMNQLEQMKGKCFFLGSNESTLTIIKKRAIEEYPHVQIKTYSPPYKPEFSLEENESILEAIAAFQPDVLFIGMTAPKQEKWVYQHFDDLQARHICCIGAVFDFYAGTIKRAPRWMIMLGVEWLYRFMKEPRRMWHRYLIGNINFIYSIVKEKWG